MSLAVNKAFLTVFICVGFLGTLSAENAASNQTLRSPLEGQGTFRRGLPKEQIAHVRQQVTTLQSELEMLEERLKFQDNDLNALRQDLEQIGSQSNKRVDQMASLEEATASLEQEISTVCKDNAKCQKVLVQFQNQIRQIEKNVEIQGQNIRNLEKAVHALVELMQKNDRGSASRIGLNSGISQSLHVVKEGDTLERIARQHNTTIEAIKEANGLVNDRIIAGRKLKIPG